MPLAVEVGRERAGLHVDGEDRADIAVEKSLVVVVAQLDELVAGTELARHGAEAGGGPVRSARAAGVERRLDSWLRLATPATPLCIGASTWTSLMGCNQR